MKRKPIMIAVVAVLLSIPMTALGAKPDVVEDFSDSIEILLPPSPEGPCDFEVLLQESVKVRVTEFFDKSGDLIKVGGHVNGETLWSTDHGEVWEKWTNNFFVDIEEETETVAGNQWNGHAGAGGIVINDSGRVVFSFEEGPIFTAGPKQALEGDFEAFCAALAP